MPGKWGGHVFDKTKPRPDWIDTQRTKNARCYYAVLWVQQPAWADVEAIHAVYKEAAERRERGENVVVDHIVPLKGTYVRGLHVADNLQVISPEENYAKSNHTWPDMWVEEQLCLFQT